jgi:hypothetical protein
MKSISDTNPEVYQVTANELRIHWNIVKKTISTMGGETRDQWECDEAACLTTDNRNTIISKIIRSKYSVDEEFATINNKEDKPEEYDDYQAFRMEAKSLADGWLNK